MPSSSSSSFLISQDISSVLGAKFHNTVEWVHIWEPSRPQHTLGQGRRLQGVPLWFVGIPPSLISIFRCGTWESAFFTGSPSDPVQTWESYLSEHLLSHSSEAAQVVSVSFTLSPRHFVFVLCGHAVGTHKLSNKMEWLALVPPLPSRVTWHKTLTLPGLPFLFSGMRDNDGTHVTWLLWGLDVLLHLKHLEHCLC